MHLCGGSEVGQLLLASSRRWPKYQLNAASVKLTEEIRSVWNPNPKRAEADRLRIVADGQYLKVVVEDDLGVEIELDQRSEGFQWLVSFFVVFFAEAAGKHKNAILLLDEPGLSLHGLKQRDFRDTISRLAKANQTIYTTHSPFLVGPDELDLVRVVEMTDRKVGTKVHTTVMADDPASLLPLQEALGYDLAQSLFAQQRNLVLEGLTDFWYLEATSDLLRDGNIVDAPMSVSSSGGFQMMSSTVDANGNIITKISRFDINPDSEHVQRLGEHLNLETQINGVPVTSGPLADPHTPIDPATIRPGDVP